MSNLHNVVIFTAHGCGPCHMLRSLGTFRTDSKAPERLVDIPDGYGWDANFFWRLITGRDRPIDYGGQEIKLANVAPQTEVQAFTPAVFNVYEIHMSSIEAREPSDVLEFTHFFLNLENVLGETGYRVHIRRRRYIRGEHDEVSLSSDGQEAVLLRRQKFSQLLATAFPIGIYRYPSMAGFPAFGICSRSEWQLAFSDSSYVPYMIFSRQYTVPINGVWSLAGQREIVSPVEFVSSHAQKLETPEKSSFSQSVSKGSNPKETTESFVAYNPNKRTSRFVPQKQ